MNTITPVKLDDKLSFGIECAAKKARLIVYESGVEKVCRKETLKDLASFIQSGDSQLFKGRLRLYKNGADIAIEVKGELVGQIDKERFERYLDSLL